MLGSMLSIKPIVDISTGVVEEAGKHRTRKKSLVWLYDKMKAAGAIERVAVYHGDAPDIEEFLHYRSVDVSTLKELAKRWNPAILRSAPRKNEGHRALDDLRESVEELPQAGIGHQDDGDDDEH
jgi:hypothetical protein